MDLALRTDCLDNSFLAAPDDVAAMSLPQLWPEIAGNAAAVAGEIAAAAADVAAVAASSTVAPRDVFGDA